MNVCVNSCLDTSLLSSKECFDEAHTADYIFNYVDKGNEDIRLKVEQVMTDNASHNMVKVELLLTARPNMCCASCAAHALNLMLEGLGNCVFSFPFPHSYVILHVFLFSSLNTSTISFFSFNYNEEFQK